jgi:hypothetical protein
LDAEISEHLLEDYIFLHDKNCQSHLQLDKIFLISETKSSEVNNLGTKLAWIINYIKQTPNKYRIIFSLFIPSLITWNSMV